MARKFGFVYLRFDQLHRNSKIAWLQSVSLLTRWCRGNAFALGAILILTAFTYFLYWWPNQSIFRTLMVIKEDKILFTMCVLSILVNTSETYLYITIPDICSISILLYIVSLGFTSTDVPERRSINGSSSSFNSEIYFRNSVSRT